MLPKNMSIRFLVAPALLLLTTLVSSQREAFTLLRLGKRADVAGLLRVEKKIQLPGKETAVEFICITPVKGLLVKETVTVISRPPLCMTPSVSTLPGGQVYMVFLRRDKVRSNLFMLLPGGLIPGKLAIAQAAKALLQAKDRTSMINNLRLQIANQEERIREDAILSLFRLPTRELLAQKERIRSPLRALIKHQCRHPGQMATWSLRLATRLDMAEVVPDVATLCLAAGDRSPARDFLVKTMRNLDRDGAARALKDVKHLSRKQAVTAARILGDLESSASIPSLEELAGHQSLDVRHYALTALARIAPQCPQVRNALRTSPTNRLPLVRALLGSKHPQAGKILAEEAARNGEVAKAKKDAIAQPIEPPRFRALRLGRRK